jgi:DNA helicase HerA-like ATPase
VRLPRDTERHAIFGKTGSGKTHFGLWALSHRSYPRMPWVVLDFKGDGMISAIPGIEAIDLRHAPPRRPGLYVARPLPSDVDDGIVSGWLMAVWARERTGLFIDEGYMLPPRDRALRAVLTQGRSKRIPIIALSQRPAWISPFVMSEAEHLSVFFLQTPADIERVGEWMPPAARDPSTLPNFHALHYCVPSREFAHLGPCEDEARIMQRFEDRRPRRWRL